MCSGRQNLRAAVWYVSGPLLSTVIQVTMLIIGMHLNVLHCHLMALCCLLCMKPFIVHFGIPPFTDNRMFILCSNDFTFYTVCKPLHPENLKFLNNFFFIVRACVTCSCVCVCVCVCVCKHVQTNESI